MCNIAELKHLRKQEDFGKEDESTYNTRLNTQNCFFVFNLCYHLLHKKTTLKLKLIQNNYLCRMLRMKLVSDISKINVKEVVSDWFW